jgi:hypothetical protein
MAGLQLYYVFFLVTSECVTGEEKNAGTESPFRVSSREKGYLITGPITIPSLFLQLPSHHGLKKKQAYLPPNVEHALALPKRKRLEIKQAYLPPN